MSDFLKKMNLSSSERAEEAKKRIPLSQLKQNIENFKPLPLRKNKNFNIIAEIKKTSPAVGSLVNDSFDIDLQAKNYTQENSVAAISVLTEPVAFNGSLDDLQKVVAISNEKKIPCMRKDFIVDEYQIYEAASYGASGVLLIVKSLDTDKLKAFIELSLSLNLFMLIECFDEADIAKAHNLLIKQLSLQDFSEKILMGINCRNLLNLQIEPERFHAFANLKFEGFDWVAESGIESKEFINELVASGYSYGLIGSALMTSNQLFDELN